MLTEKEYKYLLRYGEQRYADIGRNSSLLLLLQYYPLKQIAKLKVGDKIQADEETLKTLALYIKRNGLNMGDSLFTKKESMQILVEIGRILHISSPLNFWGT